MRLHDCTGYDCREPGSRCCERTFLCLLGLSRTVRGCTCCLFLKAGLRRPTGWHNTWHRPAEPGHLSAAFVHLVLKATWVFAHSGKENHFHLSPQIHFDAKKSWDSVWRVSRFTSFANNLTWMVFNPHSKILSNRSITFFLWMTEPFENAPVIHISCYQWTVIRE